MDDAPTLDDRETTELVVELLRTGNLNPLIARLRNGDLGPESARAALLVLSEYDAGFLVQVTLDALITTYLDDPGLAHQPQRETRPEG